MSTDLNHSADPAIFKCFVHNKTFNTEQEWNEHLHTTEHEHTGTAPCNQCGIPTEFKYFGKLGGNTMPSLCKACKQKLLSELG